MKHIIALAISAAAALSAAALDVESSAGSLREAVGASTGASELKVRGSVNAADLMFIQSEMASLTSLDLSEAVLAEYSGDPLLNSVASSPAGAIPPAAFLGMRLATFAFPSNTTSIGEGAFAATALTAAVVPQGVTFVGNSAYADCPALVSASVPASVSRLGSGVFRG
ncbi:MAG: leucine-rich repeat domain-containing protein, partial [Muribaculaceae bacterium]|nr:leucine-rich repeat domain-containing protein [Muribaculaceae bacterium]